MNEEQAVELLVKVFGYHGAVDLTALEAKAAGTLVFGFDWPCELTEKEKGSAAYALHVANRTSDMVTCRCAIDSVIYKAGKYAQSQTGCTHPVGCTSCSWCGFKSLGLL